MPNLIGSHLQHAQNEIQRITNNDSSKDLTGDARAQIIDSNWQVCSSMPAFWRDLHQGHEHQLRGCTHGRRRDDHRFERAGRAFQHAHGHYGGSMEPLHPGDRTYRNQTLRLADLTVLTDTIQGMTFENCALIGPAVVVFQNCTVQSCAFQGSEDEILWPLAGRLSVVGAVAFVGCTIVGCRFERIGVTGTDHDLQTMRASLRGGR